MSLTRSKVHRRAALVVALALLTACDSDVTINYQEVATCRSFPGFGGSAPGFESFVFYKLVSIENQRPDAKDFNFGSGRLVYHVGAPVLPEVDIPAAIPPTGITSAASTTVPKGTTFTATGGKFVVGLQGDARQSLLLDPSHPLTYQTSEWFQNVKAVAIRFARVNADVCTPPPIEAL